MWLCCSVSVYYIISIVYVFENFWCNPFIFRFSISYFLLLSMCVVLRSHFSFLPLEVRLFSSFFVLFYFFSSSLTERLLIVFIAFVIWPLAWIFSIMLAHTHTHVIKCVWKDSEFFYNSYQNGRSFIATTYYLIVLPILFLFRLLFTLLSCMLYCAYSKISCNTR